MLIIWVWFACKLITVFVIFLHVVIQTCTWFFFEVPRIEESQDSNSSPRRGEVGRRTLRDYGGFLPSFFYRARFQLFHFPVFVEKLQKLSLRSLQAPREQKNRTLLEKFYTRLMKRFLRRSIFWKKNMHPCEQVAHGNKTLISRIEFSQLSRIGSYQRTR